MNKARNKKVFAACLALVIFTINAYAVDVSTSWGDVATSMTQGGVTYNAFWPKTGAFTVTYDGTIATTRIDFTYSTIAAQNMQTYMANDFYTGMDIKDNGNAFNVLSISTSLPNPKRDMEANGGNYLNEAEVVALNSIVGNTQYYMSAQWRDYRPVLATDKWYVNSELSTQWIPGGDYNTEAYRSAVQLAYGSSQGAA